MRCEIGCSAAAQASGKLHFQYCSFVGSTAFFLHATNVTMRGADECRFIGVSRITIFARDGECGSSARAVSSHFAPAFLSWAELPASVDANGGATYARMQCLQEHRALYAFVTYLGTLDYLMVRGAQKGVQGGLEKVLMHRELRFAPGAPHSRNASRRSSTVVHLQFGNL